jgi:hypothetical protein
VGLERGPLSFLSTIEELLGRKSSGFGLENRQYGRRGSTALTTWLPLSVKVDTNFADNMVFVIQHEDNFAVTFASVTLLFLRTRVRPARKADNHTAICQPIV